MRILYYAETDSLYIDLAERSGADTQEVAPGVVLDFDAEARLVGMEIDRASEIVNLTHLEAESMPVVPAAREKT